MSADRLDRIRAVTTRLAKRDPTKGTSVCDRLKKIWQVGLREDRNVGGPSRLDMGRHDLSSKRDPTNQKSVLERLRNIWQVGFREGRNVGGPTRSDKGRHDPSSKTRPDRPEVSSRET